VSGATTMTPNSAANCCEPAFDTKFCSVQVSPDNRNKAFIGSDQRI